MRDKLAFNMHLDQQEVEALICAARLGVAQLPKSMWHDADTAMDAVEEAFNRHLQLNVDYWTPDD